MVILHSYIRETRNDNPSGASGLMVILLSSTSFVFVFLIRPMRMSHPINSVLIGRFWITSTKITIKCFRIENPGLTQVFCGSTCCFCFTFMSVSLCFVLFLYLDCPYIQISLWTCLLCVCTQALLHTNKTLKNYKYFQTKIITWRHFCKIIFLILK
jgi:hypothetical protein